MSCQNPPVMDCGDENLERYMMERPALMLVALDLMERFERRGESLPLEETQHAS